MEYFSEKNGRYVSKGIPGSGSSRSSIVRIIITLIPVLVFGGIYLSMQSNNAGMKNMDIKDMTPFILVIGIFMITNIFFAFIRKAGLTAGVIVDQMQGTVLYKRPGGHRHSVPLLSLKEIGLQIAGADRYGVTTGKGMGGGVLFLVTRDEKKHPIAFGRDSIKLRQVADELSILTSLSVNEYSSDQ